MTQQKLTKCDENEEREFKLLAHMGIGVQQDYLFIHLLFLCPLVAGAAHSPFLGRK